MAIMIIHVGVVFSVLCHQLFALECYECYSKIERCNDNKYGLQTENLEICKGEQCVKINWKSDDEKEPQVTRRFCVEHRHEEDGCYIEEQIREEEKRDVNIVKTSCYCSEESCNAGSKLSMSTALYIGMSIIIVVI